MIYALQGLENHGRISKELRLFESKTKRSVIPIMGKALNVLFGTVTEQELGTIKDKLNNFERDHRTLVQVEKRSISIINITRVELEKGRRNINWSVKNTQVMRWELGNVMEALMTKVMELTQCIREYFRSSAIINHIRQKQQILLMTLQHLRTQSDMLSLGHQSPSIVDPSHHRDYLLKI